MTELAEDDLERLDVVSLMDLADSLDIDLSGLNTDDEIKTRIILHMKKINGNPFFKYSDINEQFKEMREEHEMKTNSMIDLLKETRQSIEPCLKPISSILKAGQISDDISQDFEDHMQDLENRECFLVFSGETSSGKSSLLNLLLGVDILPTHVMSCTFIICKLKYASEYKSEVIYKNGGVESKSYSSPDEAKRCLDEIIFVKNVDQREEESFIKEIVIYLPAEFLKSGITIIDTPGIGENPQLNTTVADFLSSNTITGCVYLIRTDSGGGLQEDRLPEFLREIRKKRDKSVGIKDEFSPKSALFICNRWDIIRVDEREKMKRKAINKLEDVWPGFTDDQVEFFSTENASKHANIDREYITQEFSNLLTKLVDLSQIALETKIKRHYRWLRRILQQSTGNVISMISQLNKTDEELRQKFNEAQEKLTSLNYQSEIMVRQLRTLIENENNLLSGRVQDFLRQEETKQAIRNLEIDTGTLKDRRESIISLSSSMRQDQEQASPYDLLALKHLVDKIDSWVHKNKYVDSLTDKIEDAISTNLKILKEEMSDISNNMADNNSLSSSSSGSTAPEDDLVDLLSTVKTVREKKLISRAQDIVARAQEKNVNFTPKILIAKAILTANKLRPSGRRTSTVTRPNDTQQYVKDRAFHFASSLIKNDSLMKKLCCRYTEYFQTYVETIEARIPQFVSATKELMEEIESSRKSRTENRLILRETIKSLDNARELLRGFDSVYVSNIRRGSLNLPMAVPETLTRSSRESIEHFLEKPKTSHLLRGICFSVQKGVITLNNLDTCIVSRTPHQYLPQEHIFKETSRLKSLKGVENVSLFLGVFQQSMKHVFIFKGELLSISVYLRRPHVYNHKELIEKSIHGLTNGLSILHKNDLVHMELSPRTVMINCETEEVELIAGSLNRKLELPPLDEVEPIGHLSFLSADILSGNSYTFADDIYSLGLVIWSLLNELKNPYHEQLVYSQSEFLNKINPPEMVKLNPEWPEELKSVLSKCIFNMADNRPFIDDVKRRLMDISLLDVISAMNAWSSRRKPIKLNTSRRNEHDKNESF